MFETMPEWLTVPTAAELTAILVMLFVGLGMVEIRRRDLLADSLKRPALLLKFLAFGGAILAAIEAVTILPISEGVEAVRDVLNYPLASLNGVAVTPITILTGLGIVLVSWWMSTVAREALVKALVSRNIGDEGSVAAVARLVQYLLVAIGVAVGLQTLGLNLSAVFAASAVFAVGFGLAMQHVAENFVSGLILLVERTIRPGDVLELEGGELVRVQYLGIRSTVARTLNDEEIILPNSILVQTRVKNLRLSDALFRVRVQVGVAYESDMKQVMATLLRAAQSRSDVEERPPRILFVGFGSSSVDWDVSVWTRNPWDRARVHSDLGMAIWDALAEDGITISFPQVDVHFDGPVVEAMQQRAPNAPQSPSA